MNDACDFLRAIRENPADDALRLVFADWLDEHPASWNTATAEFIRLSCRGGKALPVAAGKWLTRAAPASPGQRPWAGWQRLCPTLANDLWHADSPKGFWYHRKGRWVFLHHPHYRDGEPVHDRCDLEFSRGFLRRAVCRDWRFWDVVGPLLVCDQSLLEPELTGGVMEEVAPVTQFPTGHPKGGTALIAVVNRTRVGPAIYALAAEVNGGAPVNTALLHTHEIFYPAGPNNDAAERARLALAKALLLRAEAVRAGRAKAGVDVVANAEAVSASEGG